MGKEVLIQSNNVINNPLMWLGISAVASYFIYKIYKTNQEGSSERSTQSNLDDLAKKIDTKQTTISVSNAKTIAEQLFVAMDGMGTDISAIMRLLVDTPLTGEDIKLIMVAFGTREYGTFGTPWWGTGTPLDLMGWLRAEVGGPWDNAALQKVFAKAGYTY